MELDEGMIDSISRRARRSEIERLRRFNAQRQRLIRTSLATRAFVDRHVPELAREYFETFIGSMIGFVIIAGALAYITGVHALHTFLLFGFVYAGQSTYYRYKLSKDPEFVIPACRCAGKRLEGTEAVLRSRHSAFLGLPNSAFAVGFYSAVVVLTITGNAEVALGLGFAALATSAYLSYVMLVKIGSLCAICINLAALNTLIIWQLLI
jgi:uncharacterized membrane protein